MHFATILIALANFSGLAAAPQTLRPLSRRPNFFPVLVLASAGMAFTVDTAAVILVLVVSTESVAQTTSMSVTVAEDQCN